MRARTLWAMAAGRHPRADAARLGLVVLAAGALVLAGCGGSAKTAHRGTATSATTSTTGAGGSPASAAGGSPGSAPGATTTRPPAAGGSGGPSSPAAAGGGPSPAAPGTYHYAQSGSTTIGGSSQPVPAQGTEVVDAPAASGGGTMQVWHAYVDPQQPPSDTTFVYTPTAIAVASEVMRATYGGQTQSYTCTFDPPVPVIGWPVHVGYSFSGAGSCGAFTVTISGQVTGTHTVTIDGASVTTYVISSTYTTKGQVNSTTTETDWFDPASRLDVHMATDTKGSYGVFSFELQSTRDLVSERPS